MGQWPKHSFLNIKEVFTQLQERRSGETNNQSHEVKQVGGGTMALQGERIEGK